MTTRQGGHNGDFEDGTVSSESEYKYRLNDDPGGSTTGRLGGIGSSDSQASMLMPLPTPTSLRKRGRNKSSTASSKKNEMSENIQFVSSLDFERVVNEYSIQATRDRMMEDRYEEAGDCEEDQDDTRRDHDGQPLLHQRDDESAAYNTFIGDSNGYMNNNGAPPPPPPPLPARSTAGHKRFFLQGLRKRNLLRNTRRAAARWILTNATGVLTGLISILIVSCTDFITRAKSDIMDSLWRSNGWSGFIFLLYAGTNLCLALLSASLCLFLAPEAVGSGIPEIKAYLNGVRVKRFTSKLLFLVKIVATILSVSSGLTLGPEGPLVHIGSILGASMTKLSNTLLKILPRSCLSNASVWSFVTMDLSHFSVDSERRDLVSIGAAAGFAAAFGAPIGGLLFSMEEASTFFDQRMFLKTLVATALATFCLSVYHGDLSNYSIISLGKFDTPDDRIFLNRFAEFPLYVLIAIGGGVLGGIFCRCCESLQLYKKKRLLPQKKKAILWWKFMEVTFVSILTSALTYYVPLLPWVCRPIDATDDLIADEEKSLLDAWTFHAHQFNCPHAEINELATIFFGSREEAISDILTDPQQFQLGTLLTVGIMFFPLLILTLGVSLPSGIFMPTFLIGSSLGGAAGIVFSWWLPDLAPSTFALLGAAALLAGIQRNTVSLCVILVEGTGQVKILIPVIVTVVIARYVGDMISHGGLYEIAMEVSKYPYLDHGVHKKYDIFKVKDIMSSPPVTLGPRERAQRLVKLLRVCEHHGFPIVDPDTKRFLGLVRRDQLVALLECGVFDEDDVSGADDDDSSQGSSSRMMPSAPATPRDWTPKPGVAKSPMMHLAYHIKNDRYEVFEEAAATDNALNEDAFDANTWLVSIRRLREQLSLRDENSHKKAPVKIGGDDSLPPLRGSSSALADMLTNDGDDEDGVEQYDVDNGESKQRTPQDTGIFAFVGTNAKGNVYISWLAPECERKWVSLGSVMNQGTYCVTESCPVSKAHYLFTALGLRHLVVLGGASGGKVVGVLTRVNLLKESLQERAGWAETLR